MEDKWRIQRRLEPVFFARAYWRRPDRLPALAVEGSDDDFNHEPGASDATVPEPVRECAESAQRHHRRDAGRWHSSLQWQRQRQLVRNSFWRRWAEWHQYWE